MDMSADLLSGFSSTEDSNYRDFGFFVKLRELDVAPKKRVKPGRRRVIVVYTV